MVKARQLLFFRMERVTEEIKELSLTKSNCQVPKEFNAIGLAFLPICELGLSE